MATDIIQAIASVCTCLCQPNCLNGSLASQCNRLKGLEDNLEKLKKDMEELNTKSADIENLLNQARLHQGKQPKEEVELWLRNVKKIEVEVRDIERDEERYSTGCLCGWPSRLTLATNTEQKIQKVTELLEKASFNQLFFEEVPRVEIKFPTAGLWENTTSRTSDSIWEYLMDKDVGTIGIYGMAGVGKTHIMRQMNNWLQDRTSGFDHVIWVNVSKDSRLENLQNRIAKVACLLDLNYEDNERRAAILYEALKKRKRFVLILDDMWEAFPLEDIGIPKPNVSNGCKLVLTTRLKSVCRQMEADKEVEVSLLLEEEAWELFKSKVGSDALLFLKRQNKEDIAREVAKECGRLPLALITIGRALRNECDYGEWEYALAELKDSTARIQDMDERVFARLEFSYKWLRDDMVKLCFLYCSLYPEGHPIDTEELIEHWIWEGLISDEGRNEENIRCGKRVLRELKDASLLLCDGQDENGVECVKVHDLMRDMGIRMTRTSPRCLVRAGVGLQETPSIGEWAEDVRWVSLMRNLLKALTVSPRCNILTSLLLQFNSLMEDISGTFFNHIQNLKVLNVSYTAIQSLPNSISNLKNLRALLLRNCWNIKDVPWLGDLSALRVLDLSHTSIETLPPGLNILINLRFLNLSHTNVSFFPTGLVSKFPYLDSLLMVGCKFTWGTVLHALDQTKAHIEELMACTRLTVLEINFADMDSFDVYFSSGNSGKLQKFEFHISSIHLEAPWISDTSIVKNGISFYEQNLTIRGNPVLLPAKTFQLDINACPDITRLSMLRGLCYLRKCWVQDCAAIEWILLFGESNLPNLEEIMLKYLENLRGLCKGIVLPGTFASLKFLKIVGCRKLKSLLTPGLLLHLQSLQSIEVVACSSMMSLIVDEGGADVNDSDNEKQRGTGDKDDKAYGKEGTDDMNTDYEEEERGVNVSDVATIYIQNLIEMHLINLPELKSIYRGFMVCDSLSTVEVCKCRNMKRLPFFHTSAAAPSLREICGEEGWWNSLEWDQPMTRSLFQPLFKST